MKLKLLSSTKHFQRIRTFPYRGSHKHFQTPRRKRRTKSTRRGPTGTLIHNDSFRRRGKRGTQNYKFEGKERDTETGNDDFGARYYSNRFGRWLSADWSSIPDPIPYANFTNPQTLNLYAMVSDDPESFADLDGHTFAQTYQVASPGAGSFWDPTSAGSDSTLVTEVEETHWLSEELGISQQHIIINPTASAIQIEVHPPPNSRTDVVLRGRDQTPTPQRGTNFIWQMDWYVDTCSSKACNLSDKYQGTTVTLVESQNGGTWKPAGDPTQGGAHDQITPEPRTFNQHWFVDGKQVQLVVGKDNKGNLIKTWEVQVVINKQGDRPVYSPVP
jgi:RHS repeat-associated protein